MKKFNLKNNKLSIIIGSLAVVVLIGIVYAVFTQTLNINGTANVRDSKWDIHIVEEGQLEPSNTLSTSAKVLTKPTASSNSISDFALSLTTPGDTIEYTFHVVNDGDYDAEISTLTKNGPICTANGSTTDTSAVKVCNKLTYTLKYDNGSTVSENDTILSKETKTMKLTVKYEEFDDATLLPTSNVSITGLGIILVYRQKGNAKVNADGTTPYVQTYEAYSVGDTFSIHGDSYHVIADSPTIQDYVVALKDTPITYAEMTENNYGQGYINKYTKYNVGQVSNSNGYGGVLYYTSATCGYATPGGSYSSLGCASENATNYDSSDIKHVVDDWAADKFSSDELKEVTLTGYGNYKVRLITYEELLDNLGYDPNINSAGNPSVNENVPSWLYNSNNHYWTMSQWNSSSMEVWSVYYNGGLYDTCVSAAGYEGGGAVRPVIHIYKSNISQ